MSHCTIVSQNKSIEQNTQLRELCQQLVKWITKDDVIDKVLIPFILKDEFVSKRLIYWTVSKHAQKTTITIVQSQYITNVYEQYSNHLQKFNRRLFDVFCRQPFLLDLEMKVQFSQWKRIYNDVFLDHLDEKLVVDLYNFLDGKCVVRTTIGQLNFFRWASNTGILAYIKKYESKLMATMKEDMKDYRKMKKDMKTRMRKRQKTSSSEMILLYRPCAVQV